ncbi:MAG TPA: PspC domain-containing protein [Ignavibacteriales bacterium]|nr:PspC domain-containing protein [Ignavibacteriales bacterium]HRR18434.1 PspC domain-containing protein [Ignavibacteriales bacterium]HRT99952.1 PspC domain-containing protein [Ignavibacteriales bacterium]
MQTLFKSSKNKKIAGVCGGLGEFFNFDPNIIRVIFVVLSLNFGITLILYIALWLILPYDFELKKSDEQNNSQKSNQSNENEIVVEPVEETNTVVTDNQEIKKSERNSKFGIFLILLGSTILAFNYFDVDFSLFIPIILIILGLILLLKV